jgi:hypothetical protein
MPLHPAAMGLQAACRLRSGWPIVLLAAAIAGCGANDDTPFHPEPPGLEDPPLDRTVFMNEVLPVLNRQGCSSINCHGSGTHPFPLTGGADPELDYYRAANEVSIEDPASSLLLLKPLAEAAGGVVHNAPTIFQTREDPDYLILARWAGAEPDSSAGRGAKVVR